MKKPSPPQVFSQRELLTPPGYAGEVQPDLHPETVAITSFRSRERRSIGRVTRPGAAID